MSEANERRQEFSAEAGCSQADGPPEIARGVPRTAASKIDIVGDRYIALQMDGSTEQLTPEEIAAGWHFCWELDGALVNSNDWPEVCRCFEE